MQRHSPNLKSSRLKARRRKIIVGKIVICLFCLGGLWFFIFWLSGLSAITIRDIEIQGAVSIPPSAVASTTEKFLAGRYLFTVPRTNIFLYPKASIVKDILESFPRIKQAQIRLKNFHTLAVQITEREAAGLWCRPGEVETKFLGEKWDDCYFLDNDGFIFHRLDLISTSSPDVASIILSSRFPAYLKFYSAAVHENPVGQNYETPGRFQSLLRFTENINSLGLAVLAIREREDRDLDVELLEGARLIIGRNPDFVSVLSNLQAIISDPDSGGVAGFKRVDYIDIRFGNKVFYKLNIPIY